MAACGDPTTARFTLHIPSPYTEDDARTWLARQEPSRTAGRGLEMAIASGEDGRVLGALSAAVDRVTEVSTVGYWLAPSARGRGVATIALRLWCDWLFEALALARVELTTDPDNVASQRVAQRCGFRCEGLLRSRERHSVTGTRRDSLVWGLLPGELT